MNTLLLVQYNGSLSTVTKFSFLSFLLEDKVKQLMLEGVSEECAQSFLWDSNVRKSVTDHKMSEQVVFTILTNPIPKSLMFMQKMIS